MLLRMLEWLEISSSPVVSLFSQTWTLEKVSCTFNVSVKSAECVLNACCFQITTPPTTTTTTSTMTPVSFLPFLHEDFWEDFDFAAKDLNIPSGLQFSGNTCCICHPDEYKIGYFVFS